MAMALSQGHRSPGLVRNISMPVLSSSAPHRHTTRPNALHATATATATVHTTPAAAPRVPRVSSFSTFAAKSSSSATVVTPSCYYFPATTGAASSSAATAVGVVANSAASLSSSAEEGVHDGMVPQMCDDVFPNRHCRQVRLPCRHQLHVSSYSVDGIALSAGLRRGGLGGTVASHGPGVMRLGSPNTNADDEILETDSSSCSDDEDEEEEEEEEEDGIEYRTHDDSSDSDSESDNEHGGAAFANKNVRTAADTELQQRVAKQQTAALCTAAFRTTDGVIATFVTTVNAWTGSRPDSGVEIDEKIREDARRRIVYLCTISLLLAPLALCFSIFVPTDVSARRTLATTCLAFVGIPLLARLCACVGDARDGVAVLMTAVTSTVMTFACAACVDVHAPCMLAWLAVCPVATGRVFGAAAFWLMGCAVLALAVAVVAVRSGGFGGFGAVYDSLMVLGAAGFVGVMEVVRSVVWLPEFHERRRGISSAACVD